MSADDRPASPQQVASAWEAFWAATRREQAVVDVFALRGLMPAGPRLVARVAASVLEGIGGTRVLDAGCGSGLASLALARRGADVTLLDSSPTAVEAVRRRARTIDAPTTVVLGSIFELPFQDETFDLVWNTGVLEHFDDVDRRRAMDEMLRVTRPGGAAMTINPHAGSRFYRRMHDRAVRHGTWDVGHEEPFVSLRPYVGADVQLSERPIAWLGQFAYAKYMLPRRLRLPFLVALEAVQLVAQPLNLRPGSLLVSVARKP